MRPFCFKDIKTDIAGECIVDNSWASEKVESLQVALQVGWFGVKATWGKSDRPQLKTEKNIRAGRFAITCSVVMLSASEQFCSCEVAQLMFVAFTFK